MIFSSQVSLISLYLLSGVFAAGEKFSSAAPKWGESGRCLAFCIQDF